MHKCEREGCEEQTENPKYCSRSCEAKVNNSLYPKRCRATFVCIVCSKIFPKQNASRRVTCSKLCLSKLRKDPYKKASKRESRYTPETLFVCDESIRRSMVRRYGIKWGILESKCNNCGISEWLGVPISLELDHINGIGYDHRLENLRMLCPNCHSQTDTYCGRNTAKAKEKRLSKSLLTT